ncbi:hypothetical protein D3C85_1381210 [compost metagenome]
MSKQKGNYVSLSMGDMSYNFDDTLAEDIARCILDADLVTVGKLYGYIPKPAMRDSDFDSWYKQNSSGTWNYFGEGMFSCHRSGGVITFIERVTDGGLRRGAARLRENIDHVMTMAAFSAICRRC